MALSFANRRRLYLGASLRPGAVRSPTAVLELSVSGEIGGMAMAEATETAAETGELAGDGIAWRPSQAYFETSRLKRFMDRHGLADFDALMRRSTEGIAWARWWLGGRLNYVHNALDKHVSTARRNKLALIWEGEDGACRKYSYWELWAETNRLANALRGLGIGKGDRVGIFMPMIPEVCIASLACSKIGAIYTPIFSGYAAPAIAARLNDCEAKALITADGFYRRGSVVRMKEAADEAVAQA